MRPVTRTFQVAIPYCTRGRCTRQHVREVPYTVSRPVVQEYQVAIPYCTCRPVYEQHVRTHCYTREPAGGRGVPGAGAVHA